MIFLKITNSLDGKINLLFDHAGSIVKKETAENRGGSGRVLPIIESGKLTISRNIILDKNIPDYE